jgi:hypothetical protein
MEPDTQEALNRLVLATCMVALRVNPAMRREVIALLAKNHQQELVDAVAGRAVAA